MYVITYKPSFIRQYKKYDETLQNDIKRTLECLEKDPKHAFLKTHKLKGKLKNCWSCSINYTHWIVFEYASKQEITLLAVGSHDIYQ